MYLGTPSVRCVFAGLAVALFAAPASAQQDNPAHAHIGHVMTAFPRTPDGAGLLPTTETEAETAIQHVVLALRDTENLGAMQTHAAHVLHAVDPSRIENGPGLGFGVVVGAEGIAQHIELAAGSEGASEAVQTHAVHVAAAAEAVAERAREIADLATQVGEAQDAATARGLVEQMGTLANQLVTGVDLNGDGRISWGDGEGGLDQVEDHMGYMTQAEGIE